MKLLFFGLLLAGAGNVYAAERPASLDWLEIVAFAGHQTDYSGVFVYQYDNRVETSHIIHVAAANGEYEKLESLDGPQREIIRHAGQVWNFSNNRKTVQVDSQQGRSFPSLLPEQLSALSENYQAKLLGVERVAGYNVQAILFQPKDNSRYIHKIWVHTDSGLLLKAAVLGDKNKLVEQYAFTQVQIGGKIDRSWVKEFDSVGAHNKPEIARDIASTHSGWTVDTLPSGFKKTLEILRPMRGKDKLVTQMVYCDGLSAISIFIEPNDSDQDDVAGLSSRGAVNLYHKVVDRNLITVVGEVPARTVMQVLDSVRYNGK
ncbi:MAG: MucB/RseB C-terminal domain-containing protein [Gallionella sp.]